MIKEMRVGSCEIGDENKKKSMIFSKKAMELPINMIVMMIIGIILFGIGMSLFSKISSSGEDQIQELNSKIKTNIASLECEGEDRICAPNMKLKNGDSEVYEVFISNKGDTNKEFSIRINGLVNQELLSTDCGSVKVIYLEALKQNVLSGKSASMPVKISANKVKKSCSFTTTIDLIETGKAVPVGKTPLIIRVE